MLNALIRELHRAQKIAVITVMLSILASAVYAGPEGGEVVGGQGAISNSGAETLINQSSQRLAVEWQSFNVGAGETVRFVQPSATAAVLNLIHDQNPSQIFGAIEANGRVFLANPNGLVFGQSATVNVGSLVAAGMTINEKSFMDDNFSFDGMGDGRVVNYGILQAANGGSINLLGSSVDNQGLIIANYGSVNLISGDKILVDFDGDGLIQFQVDKDVIDNAAGVESSVNNSGEIRADAGQVLLNANVAKDIFSRAVNNDGLISAQRIDNSGGVIRLTGNDTVIHSGDITVAGKGQNDTGGRVEILGYNTGLFENASINASGDTGGGEILIGGDYQGNNPNIQNAEFTYVSAGSKIEANANVSGDGGKVIVWADNTTRYKGMIAAKGGEVAGDGGFVEVSGKQVLDYDGLVDTRATNGSAGLLLLDPTNITISTDPDSDIDKDEQPNPDVFSGGSNKSFLNTLTLTKQLEKSDVQVTTTSKGGAEGSISIKSPLEWEKGYDLTLTADQDIFVQANITPDGGSSNVTFSAGNITFLSPGVNVISGSKLVFGWLRVTGGSDWEPGIDIAGANIQAKKIFVNGGVSLAFGGELNIKAPYIDANKVTLGLGGKLTVINGCSVAACYSKLAQNGTISGEGELIVVSNSEDFNIGNIDLGAVSITRLADLSLSDIRTTGDLSLSTKGKLDVSDINAGGDILLKGGDIVLKGDIRGRGSITLQPFDFTNAAIGLYDKDYGFNLGVASLSKLVDGFSEIIIGSDLVAHMEINNELSFSDSVHFKSVGGSWVKNPTLFGGMSFSKGVSTNENLSITTGQTVIIEAPLNAGPSNSSTLQITASALELFDTVTAGTIKIIANTNVPILATSSNLNNLGVQSVSYSRSGKKALLLSDGELTRLNAKGGVELYSPALVYLGGSLDYKDVESGIKLFSDGEIYIGSLYLSHNEGSSYYLNWETKSGALPILFGDISTSSLSAKAYRDVYAFNYTNIDVVGLFKLEGRSIKFRNPFRADNYTNPDEVTTFNNIEAGEIAFASPNPLILESQLSLSVDSGSIDFSGIDFTRAGVLGTNSSLSLSTQGGSIKLRNVGTDASEMNSVTLDTAGAGRLFLSGDIYTLGNIDFSKVADIELTSPLSKIFSSGGDLFLPDIIVKGSNVRSLELSGDFISLGNISGVHDFTMVNSGGLPSTLPGGGVIRANNMISLKGLFGSSGDISFSADIIKLAGSLESDGDISFSAGDTELSGSLSAKSLIDFSSAAQKSDIKIGSDGLVLQASEMTFGGSQVDEYVTGFVLASGVDLDFSKVTKLTLNTDLNIAVNGGDVDLGSTTFIEGKSLNGIALNIIEGEENSTDIGNLVLGPIANTVTTLNVNSDNNIQLRGDISTLGALELVSHRGIVTTNIAGPIILNSEKIILGGHFTLTPTTPLYLKNSGKTTVLTAGADLDLSDVMLFSDVDKEQGLWVNNNNFVTTLGSVQATDLTIEHSTSATLKETRLKGPIYTMGTKGIVLADGGKLVLDADVLLDTFTNASDGIGGTVHFGVDSTVDSQGHDLTILSGLGIHMESTATVATAAVPSGNIDWTAMLGNIDLGQIDAAGSDVSLAANGGFITSEYMPIDQLDVTMLVNNIIGDSITLLGSSGVGAKVLRPVVIHANKQININVGSGYGFVVNTNKAPIVGRGKVYDVVASRYLTAETAERSAAQSIYTDFYLDNLFEGNEVNVDEYSIDYLMAQYQTDGEYSLSSLEPDVPTMLRTATGWKLSRTNRAVRQPEIGNEQIPRRDRTKNSVKSERIEWINRGFKYQIPKSEVRNEAE